MPKQQILEQIISEFNKNGIAYQTGGKSDISIVTEFLDAGWSTGNKKITYEAAVFADEASSTVYMWEMTKEKGSGFSFGADSESSFQSGTTLFRKVKSIQYGPDGKAYEYTLNLGSIPKAVKNAAKQNGWKFKTVLHKEKACYPSGFAAANVFNSDYVKEPGIKSYCSNCGSLLESGTKFCQKCGKPVSESDVESTPVSYSQQAHHQVNEPSVSNKQMKTGKTASVLLTVSSILIVIFFALMSIPWLSWVLAIAVLGGFFLLARKVSAKSIPLTVILWLVAMIAVFVIFVVSIPEDNSPSNDKAPIDTITTDSQNPKADSSSKSEKTNLSMESIFTHALNVTKDCWKPDAKIALVSVDLNDTESLKNFSPVANWNIKFYSPTSNTEITASLLTETPDEEGYPGLFYNCTEELPNEVKAYSATPEQLKENPNLPLDEKATDEAYLAEYTEMPDNMLLDSAMTPNEISEKAYERVGSLQGISGFRISIYYVDQMIVGGDEVHSAVWEISWVENGKTSHFVINPSNGKTYEY